MFVSAIQFWAQQNISVESHKYDTTEQQRQPREGWNLVEDLVPCAEESSLRRSDDWTQVLVTRVVPLDAEYAGTLVQAKILHAVIDKYQWRKL